jgi:hypothetical protein
VWKVKEGVETTNMPPWKWVMSDNEVYQLVFYAQSFSTADDYNTKWGPQYSDSFGRNLKNAAVTGSIVVDQRTTPVASLITFMTILLWDLKYKQLTKLFEYARLKTLTRFSMSRRRTVWI